MVSYGTGYCDEGYYAGWEHEGTDTQEACNRLCMQEPQCTYASFYRGYTCSRYNGETCNMKCCEPGRDETYFNAHKTFKKTVQRITS